MGWMSNLFKREKKSVKCKVYKRKKRDTANPFDSRERGEVRVKAVQNGWVLYAMLPEGKLSMFQNESMREDLFLMIYEEIGQ